MLESSHDQVKTQVGIFILWHLVVCHDVEVFQLTLAALRFERDLGNETNRLHLDASHRFEIHWWLIAVVQLELARGGHAHYTDSGPRVHVAHDRLQSVVDHHVNGQRDEF